MSCGRGGRNKKGNDRKAIPSLVLMLATAPCPRERHQPEKSAAAVGARATTAFFTPSPLCAALRYVAALA